MAEQVKIYGADWCGDTRRSLRVLESAGVEFDYINVDENADAEKKVIEFSKGKRRIPLVEIASETGTQSLAVPTDSELKKALG